MIPRPRPPSQGAFREIWCRSRCGSVPTAPICGCPMKSHKFPENCMYIGGGLLGTVLLVVLIVWVLRRA